jgi:short-subunit dehydrogenase
VLNVASTAAFQPVPRMATYAATKAFVLSFSQALGDELRGTGVTVTALCPGPTETRFADRAGAARSRLFARASLASAEDVAEVGLRALQAGRPVAIPGIWNRLLAWGSRFVPRGALLRVSRGLTAPATTLSG